MFRRKKTQLLLDRITQINAQVKECHTVLDQVERAASDATMEMDQIGMSAARMDGSLTKVVDYAKDTKQAQKDSDEELLAVSEKMTDCIQKAVQLQKAYDRAYDEVASREEELADLREHSKYYTDLSKKLSEATVRYQECGEHLSGRICDMEAFGNEISALALQSAIEAGRLGADGARYIEAAQQIRDYSNKYQQLADDFREDIAQLSEDIRQNGEDIQQLIRQLKENNVLLKNTAGKISGQRESMEQLRDGKPAEQLREILKQMQRLQGSTRSTVQMQEAILGEMESIGACFLEEQESAKKLEDILEETKKTIANVEPINEEDK